MGNANKAGVLLGASVISLACASPAMAQDDTAARPPAALGGLQEVVVTAQKRKENLQSTPLAVSALTADMLESRRISDVSDISAAAPNLVASVTPASTTNVTIYIRGIGESDPVLTVDAPVGLYVDGVVLGRAAGAVFDLVDLDRVEVLRGPQGTLYGRNTTGGAVNLITAKPADHFKATGTFSYGNLNYFQARASVDTGELGDSGLSFKLSYLHKQRDGYVNDLNQPDNRDPGAYSTNAYRIAARIDRGGPLRVDYAFDFSNSKSWAPAFQLIGVRPDIAAYFANSQALGGNPLAISSSRLDTLRLNQGEMRDEVMGHTLTFEYDLGDHLTLRSLTGYRQWANSVARSDLDGNDGLRGFTVSPAILAPPNSFIPTGVQNVGLFGTTNRRFQKQFSEEIDLLGKIGDQIDFVLGGFYFRESATENNPQYLTVVLPSPVPIPLGSGLSTSYFGVPIATTLAYRHISESGALFGQATWHVTDRLGITGGIRYTQDHKWLDQTTPIARNLNAGFNQVNWAASIDYKLNSDVMLYARAATGYKAGGFNPRSVGGSFDPEKLISYEGGVKSELFGHRLRVNLTGFYSRYKDLQVSQFLAGTGGASSITVNAGRAHYAGVEAELLAQPIHGITINATGGYVDRKFDSFIIRDPVSNQLIDVADEARFQYSASTTANAGIQYESDPLSFGKLLARVDWTYRSRVYFHPLDRLNPFNEQLASAPVGRFDARLALSDIDLGQLRASVALWTRNLTDRQYRVSGIDFGSLGFAGAVYAEPRTFGLDVKLDM